MELYLARTQGFCAGVSYAIAIVEQAIERFGLPIYIYHEIVHNSFVVQNFRDRGVIFVEHLDEVPPGSRLIFSAHGVPPSVIAEATQRGIHYIDATCPLVKKVHNAAIRYSQKQYQTVLIGHKGHQEMIGTAGYVDKNFLHIVEKESDVDNLPITQSDPLAYLTQTTLSIDEAARIISRIKTKYPNIVEPRQDDICYATQNRQNAVKELAKFCDMIIICGSANSSNSNRLRETGAAAGVTSIIIDSVANLDFAILADKKNVGISSGASVPRVIVDDLVKKISDTVPGTHVHTFPDPEKNINFPIPPIG